MMIISREERYEWYELSVCIDCICLIANGECDPDEMDRVSTALAQRHAGWQLCAGGEHQEQCSNRDKVSGMDECDCEDLGFSWRSCDGCGSSLGGDRHQATAMREKDHG
jgi:hypothetical protein